MQNTVTVESYRLLVQPVGINKLWGLRRRIGVPLSQVRGATYDPGVRSWTG